MRDLSNPGIPLVSVRGKMMEKEYSCEGPLNRGNESLPSPNIYYITFIKYLSTPYFGFFAAALTFPSIWGVPVGGNDHTKYRYLNNFSV